MKKSVEKRILSRFTNYLGKKLVDNRILFYILNFTWGILANIIGAFVYIALFFFAWNSAPLGVPLLELKKQPKSGGFGFSIGVFTFTTPGCGLWVKAHEFGHSVQNAIYGPFMIFIILIPSMIRFHYRNYKKSKTDYDNIWFEYTASKLGDYTINGEQHG